MDACYSLHYRKIRILTKMYLFNLQVIPRWCADKRPCWEKIVERWTDPGWQDEHKVISERRKLMGVEDTVKATSPSQVSSQNM